MSTVTNNQQPTYEQLKARLAEMEARLAAKNNGGTVSWIIGEQNGNVIIHGLGRFPVTLYHSQLVKLSEKMPEIVAFAEKHRALLSDKTDSTQVTSDKLQMRKAASREIVKVASEKNTGTPSTKNNAPATK